MRPRTLETDPVDLLPMAPGRAVYLWPASPRLRTGAWIAVHYFMDKPRTIRRYDPELLYQKADSYFVTQVGGALRLGPVEVSVSVPFAGLVMAEFYEKGVVDHVFRELDRADMNMAVKYGFRIRRGRDLWLVTPYVALTAPTQRRDSYEINLGGHLLWHHTAPPRSMSLLPGLATGWRRNMWSAVISIGCLVTMPLERDSDLDESEPPQELQVGLMSAYQLGFAPFRDLGFSLALLHLRELSGPAKEQEDRFWAALGVRMQPYAGLYGHLGFMVPLERISRDSPSLMLTLQAGWEFR